MSNRITVTIKSWNNFFISFFLVVITFLCIFPTFLHGEDIQEPSRWKIVSVVSASDSDKLSLNLNQRQQQQQLQSHLQPNHNSTLHSNLESNDDSNLTQSRTSKNRFKSNHHPTDDETTEFKRAYNSNPKKNHPSSPFTTATSDDDELRDSDEYNDYEDDDGDSDKLKDDTDDINKDEPKFNNWNRRKKQPGVSTTTKIPTSKDNKNQQHNIDIYNEDDDVDDDEEEVADDNEDKVVDGEEEQEDDYDDDDDDDDVEEEEDENSDTDFRREDLIDAVTELERDAQVEEQSGLLPQVLGLFGQGTMNKKRNNNYNSSTSSLMEFEGLDQLKYNSSDEDSSLLPEDLNELSEDIVDDIAAGVEESLLLSDRSGHFGKRRKKMNETEMRQFPMYLFQGQYMPEPRLNRFIDGAIRNMGSELRIDVMDPLYFRVLPRGRVESRPQPVGKFRSDLPPGLLKSDININNNNSKKNQNIRQSRQNRFFNTLNSLTNNKKKKAVTVVKTPKKSNGKKRGVVGGRRRRRRKNGQRRRKPGVKRQPNNGNPNRRRKVIRRRQPFKRRPGVGGGVVRRRRPNGNGNGNRNRNKNKNRNPNRNKKKRPNKKRPGNKKNNRQKRRVKRNVGGGRVEGLSSVQRDGDAEMQAFGNYTLVRSHMKMGPVEISMQFRTRRGLRRTGATLPVIRMHTVTRVSMEGSEMIDFLLDRPHPESIKVRGKLFPLAQRIARNIFARLFVPNSFLTSRLREKSALALLSKPKK